MKKVKFLILFVLILAMSGLYAVPQREVPYYDGAFGYSVENGKATVIVYNGSDENLIIPEKVGGYEVTSIDTWHTDSSQGIFTTMEISNSVIIIDGYNFGKWDSLTEIILSEDHPVYSFSEGVLFDKTRNMLHTYLVSNTETAYAIPDSVTSIGDLAFSRNDSLTSIEIPNSVTHIGGGAFWNCDSLTTLEIPDSVTSIGNEAFMSCSSLTTIKLSDSITSIGTWTFWNCTSLTTIEIPNSVTSIGYRAFENCSSLTTLIIPDSVTSIEEGAFLDCSSLTMLEIPDSVTSIGDWAFENCSSLTTLIIPDSVTSIGEGAFFDCNSLILTLEKNSYAHKYALENDIDFILKKSFHKSKN